METVFGLFGKQPISGKVKTRLAGDIGPVAAALLYEAFLADLVARFQSCADRRLLGYTPANAAAVHYFLDLAAGRYQLWAQPEASLGERIQAFFTEFLAAGGLHRPTGPLVVLIGSDSPTLPVALVGAAFASLDTADCVLGPATDGGFYLVGLRKWAPGLFDHIGWGESRVLEQTVRNFAAHDFSLHLLPPWYDVDTRDDLDTLRGHLAALSAAGEPEFAPRTSEVLRQLSRGRSGGAHDNDDLPRL